MAPFMGRPILLKEIGASSRRLRRVLEAILSCVRGADLNCGSLLATAEYGRAVSLNILFIKWKSMGDVVFTLPAIGMLRANFPDAKITYFTLVEYEPIAAAFSQVDEVLALDRGIYKRKNFVAMGRTTRELLRRLRRGHFSMVIDSQCYTETAALAWFTRAPQRWGFQLGRRLRRWAYTHSLPRPDDYHPVDANLKLLAQFGLKPVFADNEIRLPAKSREDACAFLAQHGLGAAGKTVFIQPFTSAWHKNWPLENFLAVADDCRSKGVRVIFGGGPKERELLQPAIAAGFPVCAGLPLVTVAGIVNQATLVLGGDTGVLHLAAAMGRHVLMLFKPYGPGSTGPYGHPDWIIPPPEGGRVQDIPIKGVTEAIDRVMLAQ